MNNSTKKRKFLFGVGISIAIIVLAGSLIWQFHFSPLLSWYPIANPNFHVVWNENDSTVTIDFRGLYDFVFSTQEPVVYVGNERIYLRDGARVIDGFPHARVRDFNIFNSWLSELMLDDSSELVPVIINGLYGQGLTRQNEMIHSFLGGTDARERFELYFQWYNTIHELGHLITFSYGTYDPNNMENTRHMVDEEVLVNSFAVAFWMNFGEEEKLYALEEAVSYILGNLHPPVDNMTHLEFMREMVDNNRLHEVSSFEIYGWFQFNMVKEILQNRESLNLEALLMEMTGNYVNIQTSERLIYPSLGEYMTLKILADAVSLLRTWGVHVPSFYLAFSTDPNDHALIPQIPRRFLERNIELGRILPVY